MLLRDLNGKSVCILGFGREGKAVLAALERFAPDAEVTVADENPDLHIAHCTLQIGERYLENLRRFDVVIKSPGIPPSKLLTAHCSLLTSSTQLFLDEAAERGATVIGVTGSKGKSTTATLIYDILKASQLSGTSPPGQWPFRTGDQQPFLVGNIGDPAIAHVEDADVNTFFVLEMSSYQLMECTSSPPIAVIASFFPEHLDYHGSLETYKEAKMNITRYQTEDDYVFFDALSSGAEEIAHAGRGQRIAVHAEDLPFEPRELILKGEHNRRNAAIAFLVTRLLGVPARESLSVIRAFRGLPHRLQSLCTHGGIEWVDDAISTTPESAIAALDALGNRVIAIILGGQDRGNDFTALGKRIAASKIRTVILFPGSGPRIRKAIEEAGAKVEFADAASMEDAVNAAKFGIRNAPACRTGREFGIIPIVLLSTASPSYGMFKNFEEKGRAFAGCIRKFNEQT